MKTDETRGGTQAVSQHGDLPQRATGDSGAPATKYQLGHSPGPWRVGEMGYTGIDVRLEHSSMLIASVCRERNWAEGNARLIAAAPDLLDALRNICAAYNSNAYSPNSGQRYAQELAVNAIAKAEGR